MTRSSIRTLLAVAAGALALATTVPVFAQATITITGSGCTAWQLSGSPPSQTLTCITGAASTAKPACLVQGPSTGTVGAAIGLVARCTPEATSFSWTGGSCAGKSGMTCAANEALTGNVTYTVTGTNANGAGPASPNFVVNWVAAPPPAPTGCSFSAKTPSSGTLANTGGAVSMTATCAGTVTAWTWTKNVSAWAADGAVASSTKSDTLPSNPLTTAVNYTYTAQACNGASCAAAISTTFTVAGSGGGGGGGGPISCAGFNKTILIDVVWNDSPHRYLTSIPPVYFTDHEAVVVRITVPPGTPNSTTVGTLGSDEYYGTTHWRARAFSTQSCDWSSPSVLNYWEGAGGTQRFSVGTAFGAYPVLVPGQTYYFNIKNELSNGAEQCSPAGTPCDLGIDWQKPPGS